MGSTDTALRSGSGTFGFVLLIEGFPYVVSDCATTAPVVTAYAGSGWTQALPGLKVIGSIKQSIEPFKADLDIPTLTFQVMDVDGNDIFGKAVWRTKPGASSRLTDVFSPAPDGTGVIDVRDNTDFAASGSVYLGTRRIDYSGKVGSTQLTVTDGNTLGVFAADSPNKYTRPQRLAGGQSGDLAAPPRVSDTPQAWNGKKVALYMHRIVGGVWDTVAQAHLEFAGTISKIEDGAGVTILSCTELRKQIEDAVLLENQWVGLVKEGIQLSAGDKIKIVLKGAADVTVETGEFVVVSSGASGDAEANAGLYPYATFLQMLESFLFADALTGTWSFSTGLREQGYRTIIKLYMDSDTARAIEFWSNSAYIMEFMGFSDFSAASGSWLKVGRSVEYNSEFSITSIGPPYRTRPLDYRGRNNATVGDAFAITGIDVEIDSNDGEWFNHTDYLPADVFPKESANWSFVLIGESQLALAEFDSDSLLTNVVPVGAFSRNNSYRGWMDPGSSPGITMDDAVEGLTVRQVVLLTGQFSEVMPRLFASIQGEGVNHDDYDVLPFGAAIPWSLLGDTFVDSCAALEATEVADSISVLLVKPTKLKDVLIPELALRFAFLVFKDGVYQFVSPPVPNALTADHELTEANKAAGPGEQVPMSASQWTSEYLTNVIKVNTQRDAKGDFRGDVLTVIDKVSIDLHGQAEPLTIDAVNSVADDSGMGGTVAKALVANLATRVFPTFGYPLRLVTRPIAPTLYHAAPGDTATLTDDLVRDPVTGARGISGRACVVLSSVHDYGHEGGRMMGEATVLLSEEDRTYALAPAAEIDTTYTSGLYTNGYDSTNFRLKLKDHSFSRSADEDKDVTRFANGDLVRILELDCTDSASPDAWSRTLHASAGVDTSTGYIQMTASLSSPSWSGASKKFVVIPQSYSSVQASQKLAAFQADDADGMIQNVIEPNGYGTQWSLNFNHPTGTELPALLAEETYGDGKPLTPFQGYYLSRGLNNLIQRKTATHRPVVRDTYYATTSATYELLQILPFLMGGMPADTGRIRYISVAVHARSTSGGQVDIQVISSRLPPSGSSNTGFSFGRGHRIVSFSTSSTTSVILGPEDLLPVWSTLQSHTWLSVIAKAEPGTECRIYGLPTLYLKPML
jgi:hypothetical protein